MSRVRSPAQPEGVRVEPERVDQHLAPHGAPDLVVGTQEDLEQIAAGDDADETVLLVDHRQTLDAVPRHQPGGLRQAGTGPDRHRGCRHDSAGRASPAPGGTQAGTAAELAPDGETATGSARPRLPLHQVGLRDDPDDLVVLVDHGQPADAAVAQEAYDVLERGAVPGGDDVATHDLADPRAFHGCPPSRRPWPGRRARVAGAARNQPSARVGGGDAACPGRPGAESAAGEGPRSSRRGRRPRGRSSWLPGGRSSRGLPPGDPASSVRRCRWAVQGLTGHRAGRTALRGTKAPRRTPLPGLTGPARNSSPLPA